MKSWTLLMLTIWLACAVVLTAAQQDLIDDENELFGAEDAAAAASAAADSTAEDVSDEEADVDEQMNGNIRVARAAQQPTPQSGNGGGRNRDRANNGQSGRKGNGNGEKNGNNKGIPSREAILSAL